MKTRKEEIELIVFALEQKKILIEKDIARTIDFGWGNMNSRALQTLLDDYTVTEKLQLDYAQQLNGLV